MTRRANLSLDIVRLSYLPSCFLCQILEYLRVPDLMVLGQRCVEILGRYEVRSITLNGDDCEQLRESDLFRRWIDCVAPTVRTLSIELEEDATATKGQMEVFNRILHSPFSHLQTLRLIGKIEWERVSLEYNFPILEELVILSDAFPWKAQIKMDAPKLHTLVLATQNVANFNTALLNKLRPTLPIADLRRRLGVLVITNTTYRFLDRGLDLIPARVTLPKDRVLLHQLPLADADGKHFTQWPTHPEDIQLILNHIRRSSSSIHSALSSKTALQGLYDAYRVLKVKLPSFDSTAHTGWDDLELTGDLRRAPSWISVVPIRHRGLLGPQAAAGDRYSHPLRSGIRHQDIREIHLAELDCDRQEVEFDKMPNLMRVELDIRTLSILQNWFPDDHVLPLPPDCQVVCRFNLLDRFSLTDPAVFDRFAFGGVTHIAFAEPLIIYADVLNLYRGLFILKGRTGRTIKVCCTALGLFSDPFDTIVMELITGGYRQTTAKQVSSLLESNIAGDTLKKTFGSLTSSERDQLQGWYIRALRNTSRTGYPSKHFTEPTMAVGHCSMQSEWFIRQLCSGNFAEFNRWAVPPIIPAIIPETWRTQS